MKIKEFLNRRYTIKKKYIISCVIIIVLAVGLYIYMILPTLNSNNINIRIKSGICNLTGGEMDGYNCSIDGCAWVKCRYPLKDAGKPCQKSSECTEVCAITDPEFDNLSLGTTPALLKNCKEIPYSSYDCKNQNIKTQCRKFELTKCEHYWEYNNGIISAVFQSCYYEI